MIFPWDKIDQIVTASLMLHKVELSIWEHSSPFDIKWKQCIFVCVCVCVFFAFISFVPNLLLESCAFLSEENFYEEKVKLDISVPALWESVRSGSVPQG